MRPVSFTYSALLGAPASILKGVLAVRAVLNGKIIAPPLAESLVIMRQSLAGKPAVALVSSKKMRRLFSLSLIVSKPKFSVPSVRQSKPHRGSLSR